MKITRRFTSPDTDVFETVEWTRRSSKISGMDGKVVFEMNDAEVPASWSQLATDIMVSKYFRKAGVPSDGGPNGIAAPDFASGDDVVAGPERSARQVIHRLVGCWRYWGESHGYFDTPGDAQAFYDELCHMMVHQMCAPNSPQWFNSGLEWAYGINGPAQGHYYVDPKTGKTKKSEDAYTHPQPHACFIQAVDDDLVNEGGIMDLWTREARLFKYGSGTGTNFSNMRGENEPLSGGGKSSGLMSFLKIGDRAAGAIKSGGTTRRAAKMVCLDLDHPDIESFVNWKVREEIKVAALVEGMKNLSGEMKETAARLGLVLDYDFNGESYSTVSGQNSNNSVRIPNAFFRSVRENSDWGLIRRTDGELAKTVNAKELWDQIGYAAWRCADPGVQYDTTINEWHTCPEAGRINASNPCSEYMFLDNTACNLASLNMLKFYDNQTRSFDVERFEHGTMLWTVVLEISVLMAQFPSREIADLSYKYRTLGLGYANLGATLMQAGIPYDSERARAICGCATAVLTGRSYATSAKLAKEHGAFPGYKANKKHGANMLRVIRNHRRAAHGVPRETAAGQRHALGAYEGLDIAPVPIDASQLSATDKGQATVGTFSNHAELLEAARHTWDEALRLGEKHGFRNAQSTVIAPTGTIGLLMDCDTTGVEPDFALVKFKKLAGGGYFKIANQSLRPAFEALGYDETQTREILTYVMGTLSLDVPLDDSSGTRTLAGFLMDKGFEDADLRTVTDALPTVFELGFAFSPWALGADCMERLGFAQDSQQPGFDLLKALGLTSRQIRVLNATICGTQTVEGAPHLKDEHLAVFDCANTCGPTGTRFIHAHGHIRMMAAAQPFISGAISKTINLPNDASIEDIQNSYELSWELGIKANALYRDGCKLSQPLNNKATDDAEVNLDDAEQDDEAVESAREEIAQEVATAAVAAGVNASVVERVVERPLRRRLPDTRMSRTHKFNVAGHEGYLTVGLHEDGTPGELFITMAKEGSTIGGLMDSLGTAISVALQYGVPITSLVNKFSHQRFEPAGMTQNRDIPFAKSLVDYIFRWMGMEFVPGFREANAPQRSGAPAPAVQTTPAAAAPAPAPERKPVTRVIAAPKTQDPAARPVVTKVTAATAGAAALTESMGSMQADAPACDTCGTLTVRSGTCYKCMNCGASMGCS